MVHQGRRAWPHKASGFGVHRSAPQGATKKKASTKKTTTSTKRKRQPSQSTSTSTSTMDMIRTVLENKGEPLGAQEIREAVKETFGVEPSKSYAQMLYKRAKAGTGFFKSGRKYGVTSPEKPADEHPVIPPAENNGWHFPEQPPLTDH